MEKYIKSLKAYIEVIIIAKKYAEISKETDEQIDENKQFDLEERASDLGAFYLAEVMFSSLHSELMKSSEKGAYFNVYEPPKLP